MIGQSSAERNIRRRDFLLPRGVGSVCALGLGRGRSEALVKKEPGGKAHGESGDLRLRRAVGERGPIRGEGSEAEVEGRL